MKANLRVLAVLACTVLVGACFAQGQGGRRGGRGGMNTLGSLLRRPDVQTELKITDDEKTKIDALPQGGFGGGRGGGGGNGGGGGGGGRNYDPAAMQARMEEEKKTIQGILTPEQFTRLNQLLIQREGIGAIRRAEVQAAIGLSDEQKAKIKDLGDKMNAANRELMEKTQSGEMDRQAAGQARRENTKRMNDALTAILTPEQAQKLKDLGGAPFTFENGNR